MLLEIARRERESMSLLRKGGSRIQTTETANKNMDGPSNAACSWTTPRRSRSTSRLLEESEIDTKNNSYWDGKTWGTWVKCQFTKILKRPSNHVLRWLSNKDEETPKFLQVKDSDKGLWTSSYAHNSSGSVSNGEISVEHRRRRHRHRQRHGRPATMGRTQTMGRTTSMARTTRLAWMAGMGRMSSDFLSRQVTLHMLPVSRFFVGHFAYRHQRMSCTRRGGAHRTQHTHAYVSRCAPCSTVVFFVHVSSHARALARGFMIQVSMWVGC